MLSSPECVDPSKLCSLLDTLALLLMDAGNMSIARDLNALDVLFDLLRRVPHPKLLGSAMPVFVIMAKAAPNGRVSRSENWILFPLSPVLSGLALYVVMCWARSLAMCSHTLHVYSFEYIDNPSINSKIVAHAAIFSNVNTAERKGLHLYYPP